MAKQKISRIEPEGSTSQAASAGTPTAASTQERSSPIHKKPGETGSKAVGEHLRPGAVAKSKQSPFDLNAPQKKHVFSWEKETK